jgi:hypothetical protein
VRQDAKYRELVAAVDAEDLDDLANGQGSPQGNPHFQPYSLADLQREDLPARHVIIDGVFPEGVHVIAGPSGGGKSYWALQLCLGVAYGKPVFGGFEVEQGEALYLSLEDDKQSLKERVEWLEETSAWPRDLYVAHEARRPNPSNKPPRT